MREDLLAERGVIVSYETIRQWSRKFGAAYARKLKRLEGRLGDTWHLDELFVTIQGKRHYLWRAVDQDGDVIDILVQPRRNRRAAERFFRKLLKGQGSEPWRLREVNRTLPSIDRVDEHAGTEQLLQDQQPMNQNRRGTNVRIQNSKWPRLLQHTETEVPVPEVQGTSRTEGN